MRKTLIGGVCLLALAAATSDQASARHRSDCADPSEVSALQTATIQQELMDAALGCGEQAMHKFNAFQTSYGPELRRSDKALLTLFKRVYGPVRGDAAYNLFKTNMASKAEIRRVHRITDFCNSADLVFAAALAANKPSLTEFVAGVQIRDTDESPIGKCDIQVAVTLQGALAAVNIVPKPNPLRVAVEQPSPLRTPASLTVYTPPPSAPASPEATAQKTQEQAKEKKKGFFSSLFH